MSADGPECLLIVPREDPDLCERLTLELWNDRRVEVRLDGRAGRTRVHEVVVVERRALSDGLRARVGSALERAAAAPPEPRVSD